MRKLYRPVGYKELDLILTTGCRRYPERLPTQPIFYPVLNQKYAIEIAQKWNTKDCNSNFSGYVTEFYVNEDYLTQYESHIVGKSYHKELWVPAEKLSEFNLHITTPVKISHAFYGEKYLGKERDVEGANYIEQFVLFKNLKSYNLIDFSCMVQSKWKIVTLNYIAWLNHDFFPEIDKKEQKELLRDIKKILVENRKWFFTF